MPTIGNSAGDLGCNVLPGFWGRNLGPGRTPDSEAKLSRSGIKLRPKCRHVETRLRGEQKTLALTLGLLFRTLAPMRSRNNMRAVTEGIEAMEHEEAAYWLGMAMHRKQPRRVLTALRCLLTEPKR